MKPPLHIARVLSFTMYWNMAYLCPKFEMIVHISEAWGVHHLVNMSNRRWTLTTAQPFRFKLQLETDVILVAGLQFSEGGLHDLAT